MSNQSISKFRVWDSQVVNDVLKDILQIKENIEEICVTNGINPDDLPNSMIPTAMLYNIATCYSILYDKLLDADLVQTGNLKTDRNNIH